jgi:hypothetical protein
MKLLSIGRVDFSAVEVNMIHKKPSNQAISIPYPIDVLLDLEARRGRAFQSTQQMI